jgi:hypothetical protein
VLGRQQIIPLGATNDSLRAPIDFDGDWAPTRVTGGKSHVLPYFWDTTSLAYVVATTGGTGVGSEVEVTNFPGTQAISAAALPLPTGAATSAKQDTAQASLTSLTTYAAIARTAFGWLRTADPVTIFDQPAFRYGKEPLLWEDVVTGTGATAHNANGGYIELTTGGTASGAKVRRATRQYFRYQPGKGGLVLISGAPAPSGTHANVVRRGGLFDANAGIFIKEQAGAWSLVIRSKTSGSVVDTEYPAASWNGAPVTMDPAKTVLFGIAYEWLGVGRVQLLAADPATEELTIVHTVGNVNQAAVPYMQTATLPVAFEIENVGVADQAHTVNQICTAVISEGGWEEGRGITFATSNGVTTIGATTRRPILSIAPALTFGGVENRVLLDLISMEMTASGQSGYWELVYNGTLTGASFANVDATNSSVQVDVAATAITGGVVIDSGFVVAGSGAARGWAENALSARLPFGLNQAGSVADRLTLVVTAFSGTCTVSGSMSWRESR